MRFFRADPQTEASLFYEPELPKPNPELYDMIRAKYPAYIEYTNVRPLTLLLWAANIGYDIEIDDECEIVLYTRTKVRRVDYICVPQHADIFDDYPRDKATELARWM